MNARTSAFGALLRQFREAAGLSQELLAERAGLSLRGVSDLERGARTTPRLETVRMLADALRLDERGRAALLAARGAPGPSSPGTSGRIQLPTPTTAFFGREQEIATIGQLLTDGGERLVSLIGPGGVGKTRLAIEVGRRLGDAFPCGVVFAGLGSVRDRSLVLPSIAAALGTPDSGSSGLLDLLAVTLRERPVLLLLDNVEQVVDAAMDIASLLAICPSLSILATSRVVLHLTAETVVPVDPLSLPRDADGTLVGDLSHAAAVALFADRARAADPGFRLTDGNVDAVASLVTRLDGLPLAIELAAARTRVLPPEMLLSRMDRQLPLLTGGDRDLPRRQQTMRNAIAWSHDLLTPVEQSIFRRLSIFRGGCTLEAAERTLLAMDDLDDVEILDGLASLVDSSLLRRRQVAIGPPRFVMLSTVREFGLEQLAVHGEEEAIREAAYQTWFAALARRAEPSIAPTGEVEWLDLLESEHDNLRSAISWLTGRGRIEEALDLSGSLWFFRWLRGHYAEARDGFESLLRHPLGRARTSSRAKALLGLGVIAMHQGDRDRSLEALREAHGIFEERGERRHLSMTLLCHGTAYLMTSQIDEAERLISGAHALAVEIGNVALEEASLGNLHIIAAFRGEWARAREMLETQVRLARSIGETWGLSLGLLNLANCDLRDGELESAEAHVEEAVRLILALRDKRDLPGGYWMLGEIARQRGELDKASALLGKALQVAREIGDRGMVAQSQSGIARIAFHQGDVERGMRLVREAAGGFRAVGDDVTAVGCLDLVVDIAIARGDHTRAAWCIGAVDGIYEARGVTRQDGSPGEHAARVDSVMRVLGADAWREHWSAGYGEDVESALAIAFGDHEADDHGGIPDETDASGLLAEP